jgi:peptidoglycan-N-acetylglucosamine deacetylase
MNGMSAKHRSFAYLSIQFGVTLVLLLALGSLYTQSITAATLTPTSTHRPTSTPSKPFTIYLGFDDGPVPGATDRILDILKKYNVKATFFVEGAHIATAPYLLRRELQEGHHIGNMLVFHDDIVMAGNHPDPTVLRIKYTATDAAIRAALGPLAAQWDLEEPHKPFRWPGGAIVVFPRPDVVTYNWNVTDSDDLPLGNTPSGVLYATLYGYPLAHYYGVYAWGDQAVVLLHDESKALAAALPVILKNLKANGVTFGTLPRSFDRLGTMPIKIGGVPSCARYTGNCSFIYRTFPLVLP